MRMAGLLADYPIPILLPIDVLLNLNRVLVAINITLLLQNLMRAPRLSRGLWQRSVIVMTFWYVYLERTYFFRTF